MNCMSDVLKFFLVVFSVLVKKLILMKIDNSCTIRPKSGFRSNPGENLICQQHVNAEFF